MSVEHWMIFGTFAQQDYFEYPKPGTYDGVVINANMAAYAPMGLGAFLLEKTRDANYVIDPLTHAFQHDPSAVTNREGELKSSVRSLAQAYGEPMASSAGKRPILPRDFRNEQTFEEFVHHCISFQLEQVSQAMSESDAAKYLEPEEAAKRPYAVIAPYFFMTESAYDRWLPLNAEATRIASEAPDRENTKLFASIVLGQGVLESEQARKKLVKTYDALPVDGYFIWVDDLDETSASGSELLALVELARDLRSRKLEVINLHGGYFSVLAGSQLGGGALTGVAHGPEFGEHRGVVPVGGGIPIARYYVPRLHARIRYRDTLAMFKGTNWLGSAKAFHDNVCDCRVCRDVLGGHAERFTQFGRSNVKNVRRRGGVVRIDFPTKETQVLCLTHYLQRKLAEYKAASELEAEALADELDQSYHDYKHVAGLEGVGHLRVWLKVFGRDVERREDE